MKNVRDLSSIILAPTIFFSLHFIDLTYGQFATALPRVEFSWILYSNTVAESLDIWNLGLAYIET
jgi:hypothetical protein